MDMGIVSTFSFPFKYHGDLFSTCLTTYLHRFTANTADADISLNREPQNTLILLCFNSQLSFVVPLFQLKYIM